MQIRHTIDNPSTASTESPPEGVIVLVDSAAVALGVQHAFSAKVRAVRPGGVSIASRCVEIPLVGGNGQISGVLCQSMLPSEWATFSDCCNICQTPVPGVGLKSADQLSQRPRVPLVERAPHFRP